MFRVKIITAVVLGLAWRPLAAGLALALVAAMSVERPPSAASLPKMSRRDAIGFLRC